MSIKPDKARSEEIAPDLYGSLSALLGIIAGRKVAQDGGADREVAHEVADHDAGGDPLEETVTEEERPKGPHEPGQKTYGRRPAAVVATPPRPSIPSAP